MNSRTTITPLLSERLQTARLVYFLLEDVASDTYSVRVWVYILLVINVRKAYSRLLVSPSRVRFMSSSKIP